MDLLKISPEWAKDEVFLLDSLFFFGFFFVCASFVLVVETRVSKGIYLPPFGLWFFTYD